MPRLLGRDACTRQAVAPRYGRLIGSLKGASSKARRFGFQVEASSKARHIGFRMEASWGARQSRADRAVRAARPKQEASCPTPSGSLLLRLAIRHPNGCLLLVQQFGFQMEASWGLGKAERVERPIGRKPGRSALPTLKKASVQKPDENRLVGR